MNARWTAKSQGGEVASWAGDGSAETIGFDDHKIGFGTEGEERRGPAVHLRFKNGLTTWVPIYEVEATTEAAA